VIDLVAPPSLDEDARMKSRPLGPPNLDELDPRTRARFIAARRLTEEHDAAVLGAALFGRLNKDGRPDLAAALTSLLASSVPPRTSSAPDGATPSEWVAREAAAQGVAVGDQRAFGPALLQVVAFDAAVVLVAYEDGTHFGHCTLEQVASWARVPSSPAD
jgi:hypothetical protein